jgi:ketosteroid isomerase-like protein
VSQEFTTPHPAEPVRQAVEAGNRGELDSSISYFAHDAFWDASRTVGERFEGATAVRGFWEDWLRTYENVEFAFDELLDVGNAVVLAVVNQRARPAGATGLIRQQEGWVWESVDGLFAGVTVYPEAEIDEARAAAKRLAEERADG